MDTRAGVKAKQIRVFDRKANYLSYMVVVPSLAEGQESNDESIRWANVPTKSNEIISMHESCCCGRSNFSNGLEPQMCDTELIDQVM